jgi:hypothetical protein
VSAVVFVRVKRLALMVRKAAIDHPSLPAKRDRQTKSVWPNIKVDADVVGQIWWVVRQGFSCYVARIVCDSVAAAMSDSLLGSASTPCRLKRKISQTGLSQHQNSRLIRFNEIKPIAKYLCRYILMVVYEGIHTKSFR